MNYLKREWKNYKKNNNKINWGQIMLKNIREYFKGILIGKIICIIISVIRSNFGPQHETYVTDVEFVSAIIDRTDELEIDIGDFYDRIPWFEHNQYVTFFNYKDKNVIIQRKCCIDKKTYNKVKGLKPGDTVKGVIEIVPLSNGHTVYWIKGIK